jgi:hypothetical protein
MLDHLSLKHQINLRLKQVSSEVLAGRCGWTEELASNIAGRLKPVSFTWWSNRSSLPIMISLHPQGDGYYC